MSEKLSFNDSVYQPGKIIFKIAYEDQKELKRLSLNASDVDIATLQIKVKTLF